MGPPQEVKVEDRKGGFRAFHLSLLLFYDFLTLNPTPPTSPAQKMTLRTKQMIPLRGQDEDRDSGSSDFDGKNED